MYLPGMDRKSAIAAINRAGALLVFPLDNRKEPASIWSHFFPRAKMAWEWDSDGDHRVSDLWALRGELSTTRKVVYTKWFRGRATYLSRPLFSPLLRALNPAGPVADLSPEARRILSLLESESPLSTKEIKRQADLQGRSNERAYEKALRELWSRLLVVAFGEVEDSSFPSLAVGATQVIFEDLWSAAWSMEPRKAEKRVREILPVANPFYRHFVKLKASQALSKRSGKAAKRSLKSNPPRGLVRFEEL